MARILIVDDDGGVRDLLATTIPEAGYETRESAAVHEGLELAQADVPPLVMIDVMLPGMSGYALCSRLREQFGELVPIILVPRTRNRVV